MLLDQTSLLAAIGFSAAALCLTLLLTWSAARNEAFLLSWSIGLAFIVPGVILFGGPSDAYQPMVQLASFTLLVVGFAFIYGGAEQFRAGKARWERVALIGAVALAPMLAAFLIGQSGTGMIFANVSLAMFLILSGNQYLAGRREAPLPMIVIALLYFLTAASFLLCGAVIFAEGKTVLTERPSNWAEDVNSIIVIICLTGVGAISLALNQARIARRHQRAALTDPLTGLLNRRALFGEIGGRPVQPGTAVILMDLDHFKSINDRFGHAGGDAVLVRVAAILSQNFGEGVLVARLGGEEFCAVLFDTVPKAATDAAEAIRGSIEAQPVDTPMGSISMTASIGVAMSLGQSEDFDTLLARADAALYSAKAGGRNRVRSAGFRLVA